MAVKHWNETRVASWNELQAALHTEVLVPNQENEGQHRRSPYVFRGMADASWGLRTGLERHWPEAARVEGPSIRAFGKYAKAGTFTHNSEWERLAIAQHNGLPTRCLDWTSSPQIAAHFATAEREHFDQDGVIWCVDVVCLRNQILDALMLESLDVNVAYVYDVVMLQRYWKTLRSFDEAPGDDRLLFFEPPSIDDRIHNQYGLLSVMNGTTKSHDDFLWHHSQQHPNLVHRVVIDRGAKAEIRDMLDQNNITERMLFPGLPGLCDWLRRYYGRA